MHVPTILLFSLLKYLFLAPVAEILREKNCINKYTDNKQDQGSYHVFKEEVIIYYLNKKNVGTLPELSFFIWKIKMPDL